MRRESVVRWIAAGFVIVSTPFAAQFRVLRFGQGANKSESRWPAVAHFLIVRRRTQ
jgi:hypothetical protein